LKDSAPPEATENAAFALCEARRLERHLGTSLKRVRTRYGATFPWSFLASRLEKRGALKDPAPPEAVENAVLLSVRICGRMTCRMYIHRYRYGRRFGVCATWDLGDARFANEDDGVLVADGVEEVGPQDLVTIGVSEREGGG
jgi:hypothetical protein